MKRNLFIGGIVVALIAGVGALGGFLSHPSGQVATNIENAGYVIDTPTPEPTPTDPCSPDSPASVQECLDSITGLDPTAADFTDTAPVDTTMKVYYEVKSTGGVDTITYEDGNGNIQQDTTGKWSRWVSDTYTVAGDGSYFASVSGQNSRGGTITCLIYGMSAGDTKWHVLNKGTSRGEYSICDASMSV